MYIAFGGSELPSQFTIPFPFVESTHMHPLEGRINLSKNSVKGGLPLFGIWEEFVESQSLEHTSRSLDNSGSH